MDMLLDLIALAQTHMPAMDPPMALAVLAALVGVPGVLAGRPLLRRLELSWLHKPKSSLEDLFGSEAADAARAGDRTAFLNAVARAKKAAVITLSQERQADPANGQTTRNSKRMVTEFQQYYRSLPSDKHIVFFLSEDFFCDLTSARMIAKSLIEHPGKVTTIVPFKVYGPACLLALAGHNVLLSSDSILAFDMDLSLHWGRAAKLKGTKRMSDEALLGLLDLRQTMRETEWLAGLLLKSRRVRGWRRIARSIGSGRFTLSSPARIEDLQRWGLKPVALDFGRLTGEAPRAEGRETLHALASDPAVLGNAVPPVCAETCPVGDARKAMVALQERRHTRVVSIIHGQGMSAQSVNDQTAAEALRAIRTTPAGVDLDIILHTPGGESDGAEQIIRALKAHKGRKTFFVPYMAFSAGTLLALTGDEIFISGTGTLGPIDAQFPAPLHKGFHGLYASGRARVGDLGVTDFAIDLGAYSRSSNPPGQHSGRALVSLLERKRPQDIGDDLLKTALWARDHIRDDHKKALAAMKGNYPRLRAERIARTLNEGYLSHGFPLMYEEARMTGLNVRLGVPEEVFTIVDSFLEGASGFCSVIHCPD